jgi:dTDP-4-dehydrorhamnose 3,5-epimerase
MAAEPVCAVAGIRKWPLEMHVDGRGFLTELFRYEWETRVQPVQWLVLRSVAGTLRAMDLHVVHDEFFVLVSGRATVGVKDLRRGSPTEGEADTIELDAGELSGLIMPRGVAHGLFFHEESYALVGATAYYHPDDHLPCAWDDPELGIEWPAVPTFLSELDRNAPSLKELIARIEPYQPLWLG